MYVCMYVCMYAYMLRIHDYIHIYIYIYIRIYVYTYRPPGWRLPEARLEPSVSRSRAPKGPPYLVAAPSYSNPTYC